MTFSISGTDIHHEARRTLRPVFFDVYWFELRLHAFMPSDYMTQRAEQRTEP